MISKQILVVNEDINVLEDQILSIKFRLRQHQKQYVDWSKEKADIIREWAEIKDKIFTITGEDKHEIANIIIKEMQELGVSKGGTWNVYKALKDDWKNENSRQLFKRYALEDSNQQTINISVEDEVNLLLEEIKPKLEVCSAGVKNKVLGNIGSFVKLESPPKQKEGDFGVHQEEPPESMQGPSEFSNAVGITAKFFEDAAKRMRKIESEIKVYRPSDDAQKAKDWNEYINLTILGDILYPIFITETKAEADRKWTTSVYHWIKIIKNRIEQSKHGAGKMAEGYITDKEGHIIYNKKGHPIKRPITRERVGDAERPVVDMAIKLIEANAGMIALHQWLEEDQGGVRRFRKDFLHEYFAQASMGSIKSGNDEYEQWMESYRKDQQAKYETKT